MAAVDVFAAGGILRAGEVVELATAAKLDLAAAAVLLMKESGGGRNVWGSDGVPTGGTYVKGAVVTRDSYLAYKARRRELGSQGVGPCQLTWSGYQDQADELGGCWDWRCNVRVGFTTLAQLQRQHGVRDGFRRYNGSGPLAEKYADDAMTRLARWTSPTPAPREDDDMTPEQARMLQVVYDQITGNNFKGWPTWAGGTEEALSLVDLGRRANVETRELHRNLNNAVHPKLDAATVAATEARDHAYTARTEIAELQADVRAALAATPAIPTTAAGAVDLDALAERIVEHLVDRLR
jgi:hypothetical protein